MNRRKLSGVMEKFYISVGYMFLLNHIFMIINFFLYNLNNKEEQSEICHANNKLVNKMRAKYTHTHTHIRQAKREGPPLAKSMKKWKK